MIWNLFITFFWIGALTFGGGYAMIPFLTEVVQSRGWLTLDQFIDILAVAESTPGPIAINMATFVGWQTGGVPGSLAATIGVVLPSFIIILALATVFAHWSGSPSYKGMAWALRPAVISLITWAAIGIARVSLTNLGTVAIFVTVLIIQLRYKPHPIWTILMAALLGAVGLGA